MAWAGHGHGLSWVDSRLYWPGLTFAWLARVYVGMGLARRGLVWAVLVVG
jgi:hypothetical protein